MYVVGSSGAQRSVYTGPVLTDTTMEGETMVAPKYGRTFDSCGLPIEDLFLRGLVGRTELFLFFILSCPLANATQLSLTLTFDRCPDRSSVVRSTYRSTAITSSADRCPCHSLRTLGASPMKSEHQFRTGEVASEDFEGIHTPASLCLSSM